MPHSAMLCCDPHWSGNRSAVLHEVAMEIRTLRGWREAFVLLKGCKGLQKHTWASWNKRGLIQFGFYSLNIPDRVIFVFEKERQIVQNKGVAGAPPPPPRSWTQTQQSLPLSPAILNTLVGKAGGWCRLAKTWSRVPQNPDFCLCLSIRLLSSSLIIIIIIRKRNKKESSCLCRAVLFFHVNCPVAMTL